MAIEASFSNPLALTPPTNVCCKPHLNPGGDALSGLFRALKSVQVELREGGAGHYIFSIDLSSSAVLRDSMHFRFLRLP